MIELVKRTFKALNDYGEFAENMPGAADDLEKTVAQVGLVRFINWLRRRRGVPPLLPDHRDRTLPPDDNPPTHSTGGVKDRGRSPTV